MRVFKSYKTRIPTLKEALDSVNDVEETEVPVDTEEAPVDDTSVEKPATDIPELTSKELDVLKKVLDAYEGKTTDIPELTSKELDVLKKVLDTYEDKTTEDEVCPECGEAECVCGCDELPNDTYEGEVIDDDLGDTVELVATEDLPELDDDSANPYYT